jgi:sugar (pentulose or hexulose) kinase
MVFGSTSANLLTQYREALAGRPPYAELDRYASEIAPGCEGLRATSSADGTLRFAGGGPMHQVGHHVRAILEGVAFALDRQLRVLCGSRLPDRIRSAGGAARSELWLQIKADVAGVCFEAVDCPEPTSMGAAILAGSALGWGGVAELVRRWVRPARRFEPRSESHEVYRRFAQRD